MKKAFILSMVLVLSIQGKAFAQTANEAVPVDPHQAKRDKYVECLYKAVEAHKEKFNSYRYKRRAIKHSCQDEAKTLFKAKASSYTGSKDFREARTYGNQYMEEVNKKAFAEITAYVKEKIAATQAPVETPPDQPTEEKEE